jgi:hypothetical protein
MTDADTSRKAVSIIVGMLRALRSRISSESFNDKGKFKGIDDCIESVKALAAERDALRKRVDELEAALINFIGRVEVGEVRSTKTYNEFKNLLALPTIKGELL